MKSGASLPCGTHYVKKIHAPTSQQNAYAKLDWQYLRSRFRAFKLWSNVLKTVLNISKIVLSIEKQKQFASALTPYELNPRDHFPEHMAASTQAEKARMGGSSCETFSYRMFASRQRAAVVARHEKRHDQNINQMGTIPNAKASENRTASGKWPPDK